MERIAAILNKRAPSGVLVFSTAGVLVSYNEAAGKIFAALGGGGAGGAGEAAPDAVTTLAEGFAAGLRGEGDGEPDHQVLADGNGTFYLARCSRLERYSGAAPLGLFVILLEKITGIRQVNFERVLEEWTFSNREVDVLKLVCQGLGNDEIAGRLCISMHTVKDHMKKIMKAMNAQSRSEVISLATSR